MAKANKVEVQRGPIVADQRTMKHSTRPEIDRQDASDRAGRWDGMTLKLHMPKQ